MEREPGYAETTVETPCRADPRRRRPENTNPAWCLPPRGGMESLPQMEPPLDRTDLAGPAALTDSELVTLVMNGLSRGRRGATSIDWTRTARRLLRAAGGLRGLAAWSLPELAAAAGVTERRAVPLLAAIELGRRTALERRPHGAALTASAEVYRHFRAVLRDERHEVFLAALLDAKNRLLRDVRIAEGSLTSIVVHPREAFAPAVREPAHAVLFVHNHPSGDPTPSDEDAALTRRLSAAGDVLGIRVLDHVVVGDGGWYSFADAGRLR